MAEVTHIFNFIYCLFFNRKLEWGNVKYLYKSPDKQAIYADYTAYIHNKYNPVSTLLIFRKLDNTSMHDTRVYYIGDLFYCHQIETTNDLKKFCGKVYFTKDYKYRVESPSFYKMLKCFF